MAEFDFTLILSGVSDFTDEMVDRLFEAGCDDATVAQRNGRVYMTFSREAESMADAICSAVKDVKKAKIGAGVMRVDSCNLVTQAEIARRLNRTRQNIKQYAEGTRGSGVFPAPACNIVDGQPLYYWCEVAYWARQHSLLSEQANSEAQDVARINAILDLEYQKVIEPEATEILLRKFEICSTICD